MKDTTFLGELEIACDSMQIYFDNFGLLPNIKVIHNLAEKFSGNIEIMPYQKEKESIKLLISVYVESNELKGKVIIVLIREKYPPDIESLKDIINKATSRLEKLSRSSKQFSEKSFKIAQNNLNRLLADITN